MGEATERFAVEASMVKVFGSETSDMCIDTCLQIFGGYGFIEEYPLARAYRDDRINTIWEGTNEINRMIITGYMMKKVLLEELSLRNYLKELDDFLSQDLPGLGDDPLSLKIRPGKCQAAGSTGVSRSTLRVRTGPEA